MNLTPKNLQEDNEPSCIDHPEAPHGFDRTASHNEDRYVCTCEHWKPENYVQVFEFSLHYKILGQANAVSEVVKRLMSEGITDVEVGLGLHGIIEIDMVRSGISRDKVIETAISVISKALPEAHFIGAVMEEGDC